MRKPDCVWLVFRWVVCRTGLMDLVCRELDACFFLDGPEWPSSAESAMMLCGSLIVFRLGARWVVVRSGLRNLS